jgi:hypothetical protein
VTGARVATAQRRSLYGDSVGPLRDEEWTVNAEGDRIRLKLSVDPDRLPNDAKVAVFVHLRLRSQVFDCGTVGKLSPAPKCNRRGDDVLELGGRELAEGQVEIRIRSPKEEHRCIAWGINGHHTEFIEGDGALGLAIRQSEELGRQAYRMCLDPQAFDHPTLEVNKDLNSSFYTAMLKDQGVRAAIIPLLIESVLRRIVTDWLAVNPETLRADDTWRSSWLGWAEQVAGSLPQDADLDRSNPDAMSAAVASCERWIGAVLLSVRTRVTRVGQAETMSRWLADGRENPE